MTGHRLTRPEGQRLSELVHLLRPDWDLPGIEAAVKAAAGQAPGILVARALLSLASNDALRTPAILPRAGRHWNGDDGQSVLGRDYRTPCPDHASERMPCPVCERLTRPASAVEIERLRAVAREAASRLRPERGVPFASEVTS